jgi:hypothetical protein
MPYPMSDPNPYQDSYNVYDYTSNLRFHNDNDRAIIKAQHTANTIVWSNHKALDKAICDIYKPSIGIGQHGFGNRSTSDIFVDLYDRYCTSDIKNINLNIYKPWNMRVLEQLLRWDVGQNRPLDVVIMR